MSNNQCNHKTCNFPHHKSYWSSIHTGNQTQPYSFTRKSDRFLNKKQLYNKIQEGERSGHSNHFVYYGHMNTNCKMSYLSNSNSFQGTKCLDCQPHMTLIMKHKIHLGIIHRYYPIDNKHSSHRNIKLEHNRANLFLGLFSRYSLLRTIHRH